MSRETEEDKGKKLKEESGEVGTNFEQVNQILLEVVPDPAVIVNQQGIFVNANEEFYKITHLNPKNIIGKSFLDLNILSSEAKRVLAENFVRRLRDEVIAPYEISLKVESGEERIVEIKGKKITHNNKPADLVILHDVTDRKKAAKQLEQYSKQLNAMVEEKIQEIKENELRYQILFNQAPVGILIIDPETTQAVEFNEEAHKQLGYSREEFSELKISDYEVNETPKETQLRIKSILQEGRAQFETKHRTKNGEIRQVMNTMQIVELKGRKLLHVVTKDVTEQKKMEEALQLERDKLETVTDNIGVGLGIISKDYRIIWVNSFLRRFNPGCEGKICYSTFNNLDTVCPDCSVKKIFDNNTEFDSHDYAFTDRDGNPRWVQLIATPIKDKDGNVIAALEASVDVTEKKLLEKKLREYSENLEQLVEKRTEQLKQAEKALLKAERFAAIGETAAMVGHDLRNPLTAIKNAVYYLRAKQQSISAEQFQQMLSLIDKSIERADKIISDLLEYSREPKLQLSKYSVSAILKEALQQIQIPPNITLQDLTSNDHVFTVDKEKLSRVFINIIKNAVEAMPNGGTLQIKSTQNRQYIEVIFADTGIGIPEERLNNLFAPLVTSKAQGMGFGLAICKRFVEAHGGTITVKSKENEGATFTITVPKNSES
ncbi:MAG: PAS domain S-box protein [Candidatus Bathyarchaeota archaeon]|nr:PAS domain S-box protein [Candidatus Bathyarchaeota archaeon]